MLIQTKTMCWSIFCSVKTCWRFKRNGFKNCHQHYYLEVMNPYVRYGK